MQNFNPLSVWQPAGSDQRKSHLNFVHIFLLVVSQWQGWWIGFREVESHDRSCWEGARFQELYDAITLDRIFEILLTPYLPFLTSYLNLSSINNSKEKGWAMHVWKSALRGATTQQHLWFGIDAIHTATCYHQSLSDGQWIRVIFCIILNLVISDLH